MADSIQPQSEIDMKDPRKYIVLAGSPVTVHYTDERPPNETTLDHHYRFERKQIQPVHLIGDDIEFAITVPSKTVDYYIFRKEDIHLIETVAV